MVNVLIAIVSGIALGFFSPVVALATGLKKFVDYDHNFHFLFFFCLFLDSRGGLSVYEVTFWLCLATFLSTPL